MDTVGKGIGGLSMNDSIVKMCEYAGVEVSLKNVILLWLFSTLCMFVVGGYFILSWIARRLKWMK